MSLHSRYINPLDSLRVQVKFLRADLLYVSHKKMPCPHDANIVVAGLPIYKGSGVAVGPTMLDMMQRVVLKNGDALWQLRDIDTLWPTNAEYDIERTREKKRILDAGEQEKLVDHPFRRSLVSGGTIIKVDSNFVRVQKPSTVSISPYAFRLAIGMRGAVADAYQYIAELATLAWEADLMRAQEIYDRVINNGGSVDEDSEIRQMRPSSSISQMVEAEIMRACCLWLGVDPDTNHKRSRGRPPGKKEQPSTIINAYVKDEVLHAVMNATYADIPAGTDLYSVDVLRLVEMLGKLRTENLEMDADTLEAFLDAAQPDWREIASQKVGGDDATASMDPYEVLGILPTAGVDDIRRAYKKTMQKVHPDTAGISRIFSQLVADAYRKIREERGMK